MKTSILITVFLSFVLLLSCNDYEPTIKKDFNEGINLRKREIGILKVSSKDEIKNLIQELKNDSRTSGLTLPGYSIMEPVEDWAVLDDSILQRDLERYRSSIDTTKMIYGDDLSVYEAAGYDTIVPELEFAKLLNVKGEIQVGDTVYKISSKGTYYFHVSKESYFTNNYSSFEKTKGTCISGDLYKLEDGIYRMGTFDDSYTKNKEQASLPAFGEDPPTDETGDEDDSIVLDLNWDDLPVHNIDAKTWIGKFWQGLFGCDRGFTYKIESNRRVKAKFYCYDYIIHTSCGAYVVMQKKNWIGWSGTKAAKLVLNWNNIIFESTYTVQPSGQFPSKPSIACSKYMRIPGFDYNGVVTSILGLNILESDVEKLSSMAAKEIFKWLEGKLGESVPTGTQAVMVYLPKKVYTIIPNGGITGEEREKIEVKFADEWGFEIKIDLLNLSSAWKDAITSVVGTDLNAPKVVKGRVQAAACLGSKWGGMTLVKE